MTSLAGIALDPTVSESTGGFTVIPAGKYKACLVSDDLKDNSAQTGKLLEVKIQILEGQFTGHILTDRINIINPSAKAQAIGQGTLKRICNLCNVPYPPQDTAGLMGKPLGVDVRVEKFKSNKPEADGSFKDLESNNIYAYGPVPTQTQQTAQPSQSQPVQAASGW